MPTQTTSGQGRTKSGLEGSSWLSDTDRWLGQAFSQAHSPVQFAEVAPSSGRYLGRRDFSSRKWRQAAAAIWGGATSAVQSLGSSLSFIPTPQTKGSPALLSASAVAC